METKIKLTLKVKDVDIELSPEEAKALWQALGTLVGDKSTYIPWPVYVEKYVPKYAWDWWTYNTSGAQWSLQPVNSNKFDDGPRVLMSCGNTSLAVAK